MIRPASGAAARVAIALPDANAGEALSAAQTAERRGIDGIWLGSPGEGTPMADRYLLTALAAIGNRTGELRLGVILHGLATDELTAAETIHLAEDLSAVDNISNGRLEIAFVAGRPGWAERAELLLGLWTDGMELSDGLIVAVTPAPVQPRIPRLVIGEDAAARESLGAGRWVESGGPEGGRGGRKVLSVAPGAPMSEWLGPQPGERLKALREEVATQHADEVVLVLSDATDDDLAVIGTVVGPCLRCSPDQIDRLAIHCFNWLREGEPSSRADTPEFATDP